jgi:hypothetical protein
VFRLQPLSEATHCPIALPAHQSLQKFGAIDSWLDWLGGILVMAGSEIVAMELPNTYVDFDRSGSRPGTAKPMHLCESSSNNSICFLSLFP